ncbi:hypothetical protein [Streptomyces sp. NPDC058701]|uniref:hypothetical protein n=1 Tax=Streptomyces sp. NPDC058701 TaxID=3346608 RepID=UPI00366A358E
MTGFSVAECERLSQDPLPSRHQRRILISAGPDGAGPAGLQRAAARWQRQYVGGVYVRVPGDAARQSATVSEFTAAGCTLQAIHFYRPADVPTLSLLARHIDALPLDAEFDPLRAAELVLLGATDVVGLYPQRDMDAARSAAAYVNSRLGEGALALPLVTRVPGSMVTAGGPQGPAAPGRAALEDHFADSARALAAEAESRLEVFDALDHLPGGGDALPFSAALADT